MIHDGEKVISDANKVSENVFFQRGNIWDKCFDEVFPIGAVSVINVVLIESKNNLDQSSINAFCFDINKRLNINHLVAVIHMIESSKGADTYGLYPEFLKPFKS